LILTIFSMNPQGSSRQDTDDRSLGLRSPEFESSKRMLPRRYKDDPGRVT
jgi:hypothetical protein